MEKTNKPNAPPPRQSQYGWRRDEMPERVLGNNASGGAGGTVPQGPVRLASMGLEGAVLVQKTIDNSSVEYQHDPRDRDALRKQVSWGLFIVLIVLLASGPRLWVRQAGYRQAGMIDKIEQLTVVRDQLKVQKGRLEDLRRVAALAEQSGLRETDGESYTWFVAPPTEGDHETAVARLFVNEE